MSGGFYNKQMRNIFKKENLKKVCVNTVNNPFVLELAPHSLTRRHAPSDYLVSAFGVEAKYIEVKAFNTKIINFFATNALFQRI